MSKNESVADVSPMFLCSLSGDVARYIRVLRSSHAQHTKHHQVVQRHVQDAVRDVRYGGQLQSPGGRL